MANILVCYFTKTGNTEKMAKKIAQTFQEQGHEVELKRVEDTGVDELCRYDGLFFGSPTYYGTMAWPIKKMLDDSVVYHRKLQGRVGGAFSSSAHIGGGNETTILDIVNALLIHGMIVQGDSVGDHYGPVSIGRPDERALKECSRFAKTMSGLLSKLFD